jgi:hypothetical protein
VLLARDLQHPILGLVSYGLQNTCKEMVKVFVLICTFCFNLHYGGFILFCNVYVCVCMCGFCNVCVYICGYVMCVFVRVL